MFPAGNSINDRINIMVKKADNPPEKISVKVYNGVIGKIMQLLGYAVFAKINDDGTQAFVNKRSLAKQILIKQGLEEAKITDPIKDKAIEILLTPTSFLNTNNPLNVRETIKAVAELEIHRSQQDEKTYQQKLERALLNDLLPEEELDKLWNTKNSDNSAISDWSVVYNYINSITDIDGHVKDISISGDYLQYITDLRNLVDENSPIKVSLQATTIGEPHISSSKSEQSKMFFPLDDYLKDAESNSRFQKLPIEHQEFITTSAKKNYAGFSSEEMKDIENDENDLIEKLVGEEQKAEFKRCMKHANAQNSSRRGFIHFRLQDPKGKKPFERIYIQINKERASDLVGLLISELSKPGEHPRILDIKVAGPQEAGRTDNVVIYIGETVKKSDDDALKQQKRQNAIKERDKILKKLKEIQQKHPELFGTAPMPFKEACAPGVAIIPGLSTGDSFTEELSKAIVVALANAKDRKNFRNQIIDAFFSSE